MMNEQTSRIGRCLDLIGKWATWAEQDRCPKQGCYGTGYNSWGVQTNQKYLAGLAALAAIEPGDHGVDADWAAERALAALRFSLRSHLTGEGTCTDGTRWGHTWISALGIERMMFAIRLLDPWMTDQDRADVRRVLIDESAWVADHLQRGSKVGITAGLWNHDGSNHPESNLWNGALLWRTATMYPDLAEGDHWREQAHKLLINSVSIAADAEDDTVLAGQRIRDRYVGPNFFPNYALDHHGYLNLGYMVICVSNAAMLHFDMKQLSLPTPATLHHHQADLWQVTRRMIFADGRLARIGGDSRVRYAYCQDYLLPSLLYAADYHRDPHAMELADNMLGLIEQEQRAHGEGMFFMGRLGHLDRRNLYYTTRLESDRACVLGMMAAYLSAVDSPEESGESFEQSVAGGWAEPDHGAVLHRNSDRLASFAWRAFGLGQGMCQPPDDGHFAEWAFNLAGCVRFMGDPGESQPIKPQWRSVTRHHIESFEGGFATLGTIVEGKGLMVEEGWRGNEMADHHLAIVALPDGRTMVGLQLCRVRDVRAYATEILGLHLNVPNDLFNGYARTVSTKAGTVVLQSPANADGIETLNSRWANVDDRIGVIGLYGSPSLSVLRSVNRRGGRVPSLYIDSICWPAIIPDRPQPYEPGQVILDIGWTVLSNTTAATTAAQYETTGDARVDHPHPEVRAVRVPGVDGKAYVVVANFSADTVKYGGDEIEPWTARVF